MVTKGLINLKKKLQMETLLSEALWHCGTCKCHKQPANADKVSERLMSTPVLRHPGVPALHGASKPATPEAWEAHETKCGSDDACPTGTVLWSSHTEYEP